MYGVNSDIGYSQQFGIGHEDLQCKCCHGECVEEVWLGVSELFPEHSTPFSGLAGLVSYQSCSLSTCISSEEFGEVDSAWQRS